MATSYTHTIIFNFIFLSTSVTLSNCNFSKDFFEPMTTRMEKTTHLHFYLLDVPSGKNATAVKVVGKGLDFGTIFIIDDALTKAPERNSKVVGRTQGMYASVAQNDRALLMMETFVFIEGKYNGNSLSMLGRNHVFNDVREMPIVGGSGLFRFARGYALAHTVSFDPKSRDATAEYNVFVRHY